MADYQIFTPPREPREDELGEPLTNGLWLILKCDAGDIQYQLRSADDKHLIVRLLYKDPAELYDYNFADRMWSYWGGDPVDVATVDTTFPGSDVLAGTRMPYFDLIAFEKGTTACKLAAANDARLLIRNAIINEGVTIPDGTTFRQYAGLIKQIKAGNKAKIDVDTRPAFGTSVVYVEDGVRKSLEISVSGSFYADIGSVIEVFTEAYVLFDGGLTPLEESYSCTVNGDGTIHASTAA